MHTTSSLCTRSLTSQANLWRRGRRNGDGLGDSDGLVDDIGVICSRRSRRSRRRPVVRAVIVRVGIIGTGSSRIVIGIVSLVVASVITIGVVAS